MARATLTSTSARTRGSGQAAEAQVTSNECANVGAEP
jgi:hypothetical protein